MNTWILLGVLAILLVAVVARLLLGGSRKKRRAPIVFDTPAPSSSADEADVPQTHLLSDRFRDEPDPVVPVSETAAAAVDSGPITASTPSAATSERVRPVTRHAAPRQALFSDFRGIVHSNAGGPPPPEPEELPVQDDELTFGSATPVLAQMLPETEARKQKQRQDLSAAGYHSRASWLNLNSVRFVLAFLALVVVGVGLIMAPPSWEPYLLAAVVGAPLFAWAVPPLVVASQASERRADVERGLPDALDMLNMGVSQGLTVQSSLHRIGPEIEPAHPELAQELKMVSSQARLGSLSQALSSFAKRMDSPEVSSFTSLLMQSEATGTSISKALSDYSDSIRSTIRERADSRANAASFKLLFPTVLCLMPSVFLFLLGPPVVSLSDFFGNTANDLLESRSSAIDTLENPVRVVPDEQ